jgi:beta-N-acetylhexosaminidase
MSSPTRSQTVRRRAVAVALAVVATALIWFVVIRGGDSGESSPGRAPGGEVPPSVRELVDDLTPEEKVDGILLLGFEGTEGGAIAQELRERQLGGVLVGARNWTDASQVESLVAALDEEAGGEDRIPPLFAVAQEGGPFRAFADLPPVERAFDIGAAADPDLAERSARTAGLALRKAGFDLNLFPVADVATLDSPIADRAYSDDASIVAAMTAAAILGCNAAEIACAPRHFPGQGSASENTAEGPATVGLDEATLEARDLAPFEAAFREGAPAVVLSHAFYTAYDPVTPASLSSLVVFDLLRDELGFRGVAITDDLGAGAIGARAAGSQQDGSGPRGGSAVTAGAIAALQAGADMLMISSPDDQEGVADALIEAVGTGEISEDRLDEAIGRVLVLKQQLGLVED